ncbi:MAG: HAD family hydrolase [Erysipelotrichaceae bacterium]|nr:HAD family hydrolase [Erysipelotrichaceae bacterium]
MFKNIVFDLYGTLVDIHTDEEKDSVWETMSWFYRLHQVDVSPSKLKEKYRRLICEMENELKKEMGKESWPEIDLVAVFQKIFEERDIFCDQNLAQQTTCLFRAASLEKLCLYDGIEDLLKDLKKADKKLYLLTNAQKVFTEKELEYLKIKDLFDGIVYSSEEKVRKPDQRFFDGLIERYQLKKNETVMIGNDTICDVKGALNASLSAIYLKSNIKGNGKCPKGVKRFNVTELGLLKKELVQKDEI